MTFEFEILRHVCYFQGMVQAAVYIKKKIKEELLLADAFSRDTVSCDISF